MIILTKFRGISCRFYKNNYSFEDYARWTFTSLRSANVQCPMFMNRTLILPAMAFLVIQVFFMLGTLCKTMTVPTISTSSLPVQSWLWKSYKNSPLPKQLVTTIFLSALNFKDGIIADSFANFFNTSICDRWFSPWKYGQVTPVLKKGGENLKSNYLPIAMLAAFNTVFERILSTVLISISQVLQLPDYATASSCGIKDYFGQ